MVRKLRFYRGERELGWTLDYKQLEEIEELAKREESVGMEETEAVVLAMIEKGYAEMEDS